LYRLRRRRAAASVEALKVESGGKDGRNRARARIWSRTVLKGYFDDSGDDSNPALIHNAFVLAGYVADVGSWKTFETLWRAVLDKHQVPYLHMRELAHFLGPYKKWKNDEDGRVAFISDLISVVSKSNLCGFGALIRLHDLRKFNAERNLQIDAAALALYSCLIDIEKQFSAQMVELTIDRIKNADRRIDVVRQYCASDTYYQNCGRNVQIVPLKGKLTFREVLPIQAADFGAWELRKDHETNNEFYSEVAPTIDRADFLAEFTMWKARKHGTATLPPTRRKSLDALSRAARFEGGVWDYKMLVAADKFRRNGWPQ
jgi:hypothetical protein